MRIMGIDFGDARVGVAVTDPLGITAQGVGTVKNGGVKKLMAELDAIIKEYNPEEIVIGLPKNMDGTEGFRAEAVRAFGDILATLTDIPIDYYDERMSTMEAYRFLDGAGTFGKKRKDVIDTLSAQIILQNYIDRERSVRK